MPTHNPYSQSRTRDLSQPPEFWRTTPDLHEIAVLKKHRVLELHSTNEALTPEQRLTTDPVVGLPSGTSYKVLTTGQILNHDKGSARSERRYQRKYGRVGPSTQLHPKGLARPS